MGLCVLLVCGFVLEQLLNENFVEFVYCLSLLCEITVINRLILIVAGALCSEYWGKLFFFAGPLCSEYWDKLFFFCWSPLFRILG